MADPTCVRCESAGVVRRERTIKGDTVTIEYTCGRCQHTWRGTDPRTDKDRRASRTDRRKTRR